ncbi:MAG TPA: hypothetical protein V6C57_03910 [Coleofasciculaceae cyanobacterium]
MGSLQAAVALEGIELAQASPSPAAPATPAPAPATPAPAPATPAPAPRAQEPGDTPVYERVNRINVCRQANATTEIFLNTALGPINQRVGTVTAGTRVTLTGVLGDIPGIGGVAQIKQPVVGWLRAANLKECSNEPTNPTKGACYSIRTTAAPNGLYAYEDPKTGQRQTYNGQFDGPAGGSRVYLLNPPLATQTVGTKVFIKVYYTSLNGSDRVGWVSQGPVGSVIGSSTSNFAACP